MAGTGFQPLAEIVLNIGENVDNTTTDFRPRIIKAVNRRYDEALAMPGSGFKGLLRVDTSGLRDPADDDLATIEGGEAEFVLPLFLGKLKSIQLKTTPEFGTGMLEAMDPEAFFQDIGDRITEGGAPTRYCRVGETAQIRRLQDDGNVTLKCDVSSNDLGVASTTRVVRVHYRRSDASSQNDPVYRDFSGSFSTGISFGPLPAGYPIERIVVPSGWVGDLQILDGSNNKLVNAKHWQEPESSSNDDQMTLVRDLLRCWPVPLGDTPCIITWEQSAKPLLADRDTPVIPISRWLEAAATADLLLTAGRREDAKTWEMRAANAMAGISTKNEQDAPRVATPKGGVLGHVGVRRRWW